MMCEKIRFICRLRQGSVVIFSGAGMSTESGLQDFRSRTEMWGNVDPIALASVNALENNYQDFVSFYKARLLARESAKPNIGHELIAKWESEGLIDGVITQNVDRLHQQAGSKNVVELHGSLEPIRCHSCGTIGTKEDFINAIPCKCGGKLRPGVVLFGEMLPQSELEKADSLSRHSRMFVVLGSSLIASPANLFPRKANPYGIGLVIINREETPLDSLAELVIHDEIGKFLGDVAEQMHIDANSDWLERELLGDDDLPNTPFDEEDQLRILNDIKEGDSPEDWEEAKEFFEQLYGYAPTV